MQTTSPARTRQNLRIGIIGAGFGGIGLAVLLKQAGFTNLTLFERGPGVGGTWRDNTYPGAACDVPSHLYSYSFAPNPGWSEHFSGQREILAYIRGVADRFGITPLVRANTTITAARYDEARAVWGLTAEDGSTAEVDIFVPAVGQLSQPVIPHFDGLGDFAGTSFHSARWDHSVDLTGKRVAMVGSAASAVQILPEIAKIAASVDVHQRTANWLLPRNNHRIAGLKRWLLTRLPAARLLQRAMIYLNGEFVLFPALNTGSWQSRYLTRESLKHLHNQISDPELRRKLTPNFQIGCKRILFTDDFYPCFNRPNIRLVTEGISHFTPEGLVLKTGEARPADIVVFATGFDVSHCLAPVSITGRAGRELADAWADGPYAYRGVAVPGFPNMMMLYGPNTNLGSNSIIVMLEAQSRYIVQCLERLVDRNLSSLEVAEASTRQWNDWIQQRLKRLAWSSGCASWYATGGKVTANWSENTLTYRRLMKTPDFADFVEARG